MTGFLCSISNFVLANETFIALIKYCLTLFKVNFPKEQNIRQGMMITQLDIQ